ncbi:MAG: dihydrofolate reductase family protein, partial [Dehalococcoidia bacterium]|nr:dihydrofolate reductase family protein [Dehalococcoidia bacterium]
YGADFYMAGSTTARTGIESFDKTPPETENDYHRPEKSADLSYWVIPDTRGTLKGVLHVFRRYEFCRDVILLLSMRTGRDYIDYLEERHYDYLICGDEFVDYEKAFESLAAKYDARRILVDTGPTLSGILLSQRLVDEISLLIHPFLAGNSFPAVFENLDLHGLCMKLKLEKQETLESNYLRMVWRVVNKSK